MRMRSFRWGTSLLACALLATTSLTAQKHERDVYVTVIASDGASITGLTAEDFAVREEGKDRGVVRVEPLRTPMHIAVIVDTGAELTVSPGTIQGAVEDFVVGLAKSHQVALYASGDRTLRLVPFTRDVVPLCAAISHLFNRVEGPAHLIDAVDLALRDLEPLAPERPVILSIGTERADGSTLSAASVIKRLLPRSTAFHALVLGKTASSATAGPMTSDIATRSQQLGRVGALGDGDRERSRMVTEGTSLTGGCLDRLANMNSLGASLTRLLGEFTSSYRLTFFSSRAESPLKDVQVGVLLEGVTIRATPAPGIPKNRL